MNQQRKQSDCDGQTPNAPSNDDIVTMQSVVQLSSLLHNSITVLPVYARFQKTDQCLTVPVVNVALCGETLEVTVADGSTHSIELELLVDVVAFCDGSGKPVFLHDFDAENNYKADSSEAQVDIAPEQVEILSEFPTNRAA